MTSRFDWQRTMRIGLGVLGLAPEVFWAMTPREFEAAVRGRLGELDVPAPMTAATLDNLVRKYPDKQQGQTESGTDHA